MNHAFRFGTLAPSAARGIPAPRLAFSGGRTAVQLAAHGGLCHLLHFGHQRIGDAELYATDALSAWGQLFRGLVDFGQHDQYLLEFRNTTFYPFGYDSEFEVHGRRFQHRLTVLNEALIFELEEQDGGGDFTLLTSTSTAGVRRGSPHRTWHDFEQEPGADFALSSCDFHYPPEPRPQLSLTQNRITNEPEDSAVYLLFGGAGNFAFQATRSFRKEYFRTRARNGYAAQALVLAPTRELAVARWRELAPHLAETARQERRTFNAKARSATRLRSSSPILDSFVRNYPEIIRSFAVKDRPGAVRAGDSGYWVWGWDSMVHSDALMLAGEWQAIRDRLRYYRDTADPELGIFHAATCAGEPLLAMAPAAQTIYAVMLYNYYRFSRDAATTREFYAFARGLLERAGRDLVPGTGLYRGISLYPDWPEDLGQTGNDLSSFNNSILFQAFRSLAAIGRGLGETADAERYDRAADELAAGFRRCFYDPENGYFFDSVEATTLEPRRYYPIYAVLRLTPFADELLRGVENEVADFMQQAFTQRIGVSMFPRRDDIFYSDGTQLGMYMSVTEGNYRYSQARRGRPDTLLPVIEREWGQLRLPEALTCEAVNSGLTPDNPGRKQQFTAASYYSLTFGLFCGLEFTPDQLRFRPPLLARRGWRIRQLRWGTARLDLEFSGSGGGPVVAVELNGRKLPGCELDFRELKVGTNQLLIYT